MDNNKWFNSLSSKEKEEYRFQHNAQLRVRYAASAEFRAMKSIDAVIQYRQKREEVIQHLGGRCANPRCRWENEDGSHGCTDSLCLQIDHVHGNGAKLRKSASERGTVFYRKVLKTVPGEHYQLLCANCNWIKRAMNDELPQARTFDNSYVFVDKRKLREKDDLGRFVATT